MGKIVDEINKAIFAHSNWKYRLTRAVETGSIDISIEEIKNDKICDFGKWLLASDWSSDAKSAIYIKEINQLHADFHNKAAEVAKLAISGNKEDAKLLMAFGGSYTNFSSDLIKKLTDWKEAIDK